MVDVVFQGRRFSGMAYSAAQLQRLYRGERLNELRQQPSYHSYNDLTRITSPFNYRDWPLAVEGLRRDAAPPHALTIMRPGANRNLETRTPVVTGGYTDISMAGRVYHLVNMARGLIVNITADGHVLHPGYVIRQIHYGSEGLYILTIGDGNGNIARVNQIAGDDVFRESAREVARFIQNRKARVQVRPR
jgi:hypothetical protein